jgi:hypothetical protein
MSAKNYLGNMKERSCLRAVYDWQLLRKLQVRVDPGELQRSQVTQYGNPNAGLFPNHVVFAACPTEPYQILMYAHNEERVIM